MIACAAATDTFLGGGAIVPGGRTPTGAGAAMVDVFPRLDDETARPMGRVPLARVPGERDTFIPPEAATLAFGPANGKAPPFSFFGGFGALVGAATNAAERLGATGAGALVTATGTGAAGAGTGAAVSMGVGDGEAATGVGSTLMSTSTATGGAAGGGAVAAASAAASDVAANGTNCSAPEPRGLSPPSIAAAFMAMRRPGWEDALSSSAAAGGAAADVSAGRADAAGGGASPMAEYISISSSPKKSPPKSSLVVGRSSHSALAMVMMNN